MKHYYATECDPENFNFEAYYDESCAASDFVWCGGNRQLPEMNSDLREEAISTLDELLALDVDEFESDEDYKNEIAAIIEYRDIDDEDIVEIEAIIDKYSSACNYSEINEVVAEFLSLMQHRNFVCGTIDGYDQSDWLDYIAPEDVNMDYIESVLFATGAEFVVTEEKLDKYDVDADVCGYYVDEYEPDLIKYALSKQLGCSPDEIILRRRHDEMVKRTTFTEQ